MMLQLMLYGGLILLAVAGLLGCLAWWICDGTLDEVDRGGDVGDMQR